MRDARRLELGQWFTPQPVARLALALASPGRDARLLDPACGDGAFLAAARALGMPAASLHGVEVDPAAAAACAARVKDTQVHCGDLFEVPADPGFDVVVGNPPYVRQERLSAAAKARVRARLAADWPEADRVDLDRLVGRGDLAAAVILRALRLCRPGGRVALVVSSALVDADYGAPLWRLVAAVARVVAIVDAPAERWFADAAVNAVIVVLHPSPSGPLRGPCARGERDEEVIVAKLQVATEVAAERVRSIADLPAVAEVRRVAAAPGQWAAALRAGAGWFRLVEAAGDALVPLGELAEVWRGFTTGANEIFYVDRARAAELGLEADALVPLVRSPRAGAPCIDVDPDATTHLALVLPAEAAALARLPAARRWVDVHADAAVRPTLRARPSWWALPARPARLFLGKAYAARFVQRRAPRPVVADQRLYAVDPRAGVDVDLLAAALNSTYGAFALESLGRASMGEGALEWTVADAAALPVIDVRRLADPAAARAALAAMSTRPIGTVADERARPDRAALDRALAPQLAALLPVVHEALVASVARRARRARS
jgi:predicted RNA methylase